MFQKVLGSLVLLVALTSTLHAQELIANGSFQEETKHWGVFSAPEKEAVQAQEIELASSYKDYGLVDSYVGVYFVELNNQSAIQQKIATKPGQEYNLAFAAAHRAGSGEKILIVMQDKDILSKIRIKEGDKSGRFAYQRIRFTAEGEETTLAFYAISLSGDSEIGVLVTDFHCQDNEIFELKLQYQY